MYTHREMAKKRGIIGRQLYSGGEATEPLAPPWTTCADAERKHVIRLRACSGRRQAFAHACSSSPCHTARSVWQELSTNGSARRRARSRDISSASSSLCAREPCSLDSLLFFLSFKSHGWTRSLLVDTCADSAACRCACVPVLGCLLHHNISTAKSLLCRSQISTNTGST